MFSGIKAETVCTGINTFFQIIQDKLLNRCIFRIQVRQTAKAVVDGLFTDIMVGLYIPVIVPN